jgi:hypothetical protein
MPPPVLPSLKPSEILALLSDEDDDDLDPLSASEDDGSEAENPPPEIVEVMGKHGELIVLPLEDIDLFALASAPPDISEPLTPQPPNDLTLLPPNDDQIVLTPPPPDDDHIVLTPPPPEGKDDANLLPEADGDGEDCEILPSPDKLPSPGSQVGLFMVPYLLFVYLFPI